MWLNVTKKIWLYLKFCGNPLRHSTGRPLRNPRRPLTVFDEPWTPGTISHISALQGGFSQLSRETQSGPRLPCLGIHFCLLSSSPSSSIWFILSNRKCRFKCTIHRNVRFSAKIQGRYVWKKPAGLWFALSSPEGVIL